MTTTSPEPAAARKGAPEAAAPRPPGFLRRAWRRFSGAEQIREALAALPHLEGDQQPLLERARAARSAAARVLEPIDPVACAGSPAPFAIELYRQAAYWALLVERPELGRPELADLWSQSTDTVGRMGVPVPELAELEGLFGADSSFVRHADLPPEGQLAAAKLLGAFVERLIDQREEPAARLARLRVGRALRFLTLFAGLFGLVWLAVSLVPEKPDVAKGKPWSISSTLYPCHPDKADCGGVKTRILFHTREEKGPWFEIDLGAKTRFSSLSIRNRSDCCSSRVAPLVVEVSDDKKTYRRVAEKTKDFDGWTPKFSPEEARYVRLRVDRTSFLHLEEVRVHP